MAKPPYIRLGYQPDQAPGQSPISQQQSIRRTSTSIVYDSCREQNVFPISQGRTTLEKNILTNLVRGGFAVVAIYKGHQEEELPQEPSQHVEENNSTDLIWGGLGTYRHKPWIKLWVANI